MSMWEDVKADYAYELEHGLPIPGYDIGSGKPEPEAVGAGSTFDDLTVDLSDQPWDLSIKVLEDELNRRRKFLWKCKDGRVLDIREMDDKHLVNVISMLKRNRDRML